MDSLFMETMPSSFPNKTACMAFGNGPICSDVYLNRNGEERELTDNFKHVGNIINTGQKEDPDIQS